MYKLSCDRPQRRTPPKRGQARQERDATVRSDFLLLKDSKSQARLRIDGRTEIESSTQKLLHDVKQQTEQQRETPKRKKKQF